MATKTLGYLRRCSDRRFGESTRAAFENTAGLGPNDYWDQANPGGASVDTDPLMANYALAHGASMWGWQAHGDAYGGLSGRSNEEIQRLLDEQISAFKQHYPGRHFRIFVTEFEIDIQEV